MENVDALDTGLDDDVDDALPGLHRVAPLVPRRLLYTVEEAEELLNISRATLYRLSKNGEIPSTKVCGTGVRFSAKNLRDILAAGERPARGVA